MGLLYTPKMYKIKIQGCSDDYIHGEHKFYSKYDFDKFIDLVDLSKYKFHAGIE